MRAAGCFDADSVCYTGTRFARAEKFSTDTKDRVSSIPLCGVDSLLDEPPDNVSIVCVELVEGATSLVEFCHPRRAYYLFGPEDGSLDQSLIDRADHVVFVASHGCLNLAASVNIVLYDRFSKRVTNKSTAQHDDLIRRNRDQNNRLRLK